MNKSLFSKLFFSITTLAWSNSFAQSIQNNDRILLRSGNNYSREFYVIYSLKNDSSGSSTKAVRFRQNRGDLQVKLSAELLSDSTVTDFIKDKEAEDFVEVQSLPKWELRSHDPTKSLLGADSSSAKPIWVATNQWNSQWEDRFAEWVKAKVDSDFFIRYNISTDCTDAVVGLRWIFARINSLPAANTLSGTEDLFGNFTIRKEWANLPTNNDWSKDKLFLAALNFLMDSTYTKSAMADGYPVSLDEKGFIPGAYTVTYGNGGGHAKMIKDTHFAQANDFPIYMLNSSTPRMVRPLVIDALVDLSWPLKGVREYLQFRWPVQVNGRWILKAAKEHPRYSLFQFDEGVQKANTFFGAYLIKRFNPQFNPQLVFEKSIADLKAQIQRRVEIAHNGFEYFKTHKCIYNSEDYEFWSTPSRDAEIIFKFKNLEDIFTEYDKTIHGVLERWTSAITKSTMVIEGRTLTLIDIRDRFRTVRAVHDPCASLEQRWGF